LLEDAELAPELLLLVLPEGSRADDRVVGLAGEVLDQPVEARDLVEARRGLEAERRRGARDAALVLQVRQQLVDHQLRRALRAAGLGERLLDKEKLTVLDEVVLEQADDLVTLLRDDDPGQLGQREERDLVREGAVLLRLLPLLDDVIHRLLERRIALAGE